MSTMKKNVSSKFIFSFILILISFVIYSFNLPQSFVFTSDFGRDMYQTIKITQADLVLVGPKMNLGGYWAGPHLYYLLAPSLIIGRFDISNVLYFHTLLFAFSIGFFFWSSAQRLGLFRSFCGAIFLSLMPLYIMSARYPSNGYTYLALLLILLTYILFSNFNSKMILLVIGVLTGTILNIHPISILALVFIALYILFFLKKRSYFLFFLGAILITFIPSLLFELTHNFVMTKDTFINQSYRTFTEDGYTPQFWLHENRFISSFLFISDKFKKLITLPPIFYIGMVVFVVGWKLLKNKFLLGNNLPKLSQDLFLSISAIISLFLLIFVLRFHFEEHYLFSVAFFISFSAILILLRSNFWFFIAIIILLQIHSFPTTLYQNSTRSYKPIEQAVKFAYDQELVSKNVPFNLIQITDAYGLVPTGFEYRFFFRKYGLYPESENNYSSAKILLIFSETPFYDVDRFKMWATEQFGREYFSKREVYNVGNIRIFKISK